MYAKPMKYSDDWLGAATPHDIDIWRSAKLLAEQYGDDAGGRVARHGAVVFRVMADLAMERLATEAKPAN